MLRVSCCCAKEEVDSAWSLIEYLVDKNVSKPVVAASVEPGGC